MELKSTQIPEVKPAPAPAPAPAPQVVYNNDSKYAQYKVVKMRLLREGTIQYDPSYPELVLNSTAPEGVDMPFTPFFASRINQTLELVM